MYSSLFVLYVWLFGEKIFAPMVPTAVTVNRIIDNEQQIFSDITDQSK
jgi:hypothetical protein